MSNDDSNEYDVEMNEDDIALYELAEMNNNLGTEIKQEIDEQLSQLRKLIEGNVEREIGITKTFEEFKKQFLAVTDLMQFTQGRTNCALVNSVKKFKLNDRCFDELYEEELQKRDNKIAFSTPIQGIPKQTLTKLNKDSNNLSPIVNPKSAEKSTNSVAKSEQRIKDKHDYHNITAPLFKKALICYLHPNQRDLSNRENTSFSTFRDLWLCKRCGVAVHKMCTLQCNLTAERCILLQMPSKTCIALQTSEKLVKLQNLTKESQTDKLPCVPELLLALFHFIFIRHNRGVLPFIQTPDGFPGEPYNTPINRVSALSLLEILKQRKSVVSISEANGESACSLVLFLLQRLEQPLLPRDFTLQLYTVIRSMDVTCRRKQNSLVNQRPASVANAVISVFQSWQSWDVWTRDTLAHFIIHLHGVLWPSTKTVGAKDLEDAGQSLRIPDSVYEQIVTALAHTHKEEENETKQIAHIRYDVLNTLMALPVQKAILDSGIIVDPYLLTVFSDQDKSNSNSSFDI